MNTDKCFCHLNGYAVKDATARQQIAAMQETITAQNQTIAELQETITALEAAVAELAASGSQGTSLTVQKINLEQA